MPNAPRHGSLVSFFRGQFGEDLYSQAVLLGPPGCAKIEMLSYLALYADKDFPYVTLVPGPLTPNSTRAATQAQSFRFPGETARTESRGARAVVAGAPADVDEMIWQLGGAAGRPLRPACDLHDLDADHREQQAQGHAVVPQHDARPMGSRQVQERTAAAPLGAHDAAGQIRNDDQPRPSARKSLVATPQPQVSKLTPKLFSKRFIQPDKCIAFGKTYLRVDRKGTFGFSRHKCSNVLAAAVYRCDGTNTFQKLTADTAATRRWGNVDILYNCFAKCLVKIGDSEPNNFVAISGNNYNGLRAFDSFGYHFGWPESYRLVADFKLVHAHSKRANHINVTSLCCFDCHG